MPRTQTSTRLAIGRLLQTLAGDLTVMVAFAAIVIAAARLNFRANQPASPSEDDESPGSGVVLRSEVICICVPTILMDAASSRLKTHVASTPEAWKAVLERDGQEDVCYGMLVRGHQINGRATDIAFVRYPYRQPEHFHELQDMLAKAGERAAGGHPAPSCSRMKIQIVPTGSSRQEILERIKALSLSGEDGLRN